MVRPDTEREKELIEAFEIVLSYVQRVYSVEFDRPIGFLVRRLLACVEEEPIEVGESSLPGKDAPEDSIRRCGLCKRIITGTEHTWRDQTGKPYVACEQCSDALEEWYRRNGQADKITFK